MSGRSEGIMKRMNKRRIRVVARVSRLDRGVTLIETMIATIIALIVVLSLGSVIFNASVTSNNQGKEATRATIYAQDKMEKLLSLDFDASTSDANSCTQTASSQPATCDTTGITASGWTQGLLAGGATSPEQQACPASGASVGYIDFLDPNGIQLTGSSCSALTGTAAYIRMWQITDTVADTLSPRVIGEKQITVAVYSTNAQNALGGNPIVVLTSALSDPNP